MFAREFGVFRLVLDLGQAQVSSATRVPDTNTVNPLATRSPFETRVAGGSPYRNLEIHRLFSESAHLIVEAKPVLPWLFCREDIIALSFPGALQDRLFARSDHAVIDIEGAARLDLFR